MCCECYGHILKYPVDETGCYKVDDDFKDLGFDDGSGGGFDDDDDF